MKKMRFKERNNIIESKKIKVKLIIVCILVILFVFDLIYVSFFQRENVIGEATNEYLEFATEEEEGITETVFSTSTSNINIVNFEEQVVPMLGDKANLLVDCLTEYIINEELCVTEAKIFHTTILQNEEMQLSFFCELDGMEDIIQLNYSYEKQIVDAEKSSFSKEEIINEIWNGVEPSIRDIQE